MAPSRREVNPETAAWVAERSQRAVEAQLEEAARLDTRARELIGFVGVILALLATAAGQAGPLTGGGGALFVISAGLAAVLLARSALLGLRGIVTPPSYRKVAEQQRLAHGDEFDLVHQEVWRVQIEEIAKLAKARNANANALVALQSRLARAYATFASGLSLAVVALLALLAARL